MARGRKTGGRVKGTPNKATAEVKAYAQQFSTIAIDALVDVLQNTEQPGVARVAAANALLDRAHGKPTQAVELSATVTLEQIVAGAVPRADA